MTIDDDARAALTPFARDAAAGLDAQAAGVRPDLAAMLARARALAAGPPAPTLVLVPRDEPPAPTLAPVAHAEPPDERDADLAPFTAAPPDERDADLAPFTAALRDELDAKIHTRARTGAPPLTAPDRVGRTRGVLLGLLAAAAAALLLLAGPRLAGRTADRTHADLASAASPANSPSGTARSVEPPAPSDSIASPVPPDSLAPPAPYPVAADADGPTLAPTAPAPSDSPARSRRRPAPSPLTLEQEAQALWERGELAAAERKLRDVLRLPDARRAELAYGDLFALTRQMYGVDRQADVWRAYLGRFPRGRFAEDARAGLCQRAAPGDQPACWRTYLEHHPHGAHRERALAGSAR